MEAQENKKAFLRVVSNKLVDVYNMQPEDINAWDIAWALHHVNRYNGHTPIAWDVLSHTGLAFMLYLSQTPTPTDLENRDTSLALLLHDASEAYICDICRPLKQTMPEYRKLEQSIMDVIYLRFGIDGNKVNHAKVKKFDDQALWVEYQTFFPEIKHDVKPMYSMEKLPPLIKGKPNDFVEVLQFYSNILEVQNIDNLFECPQKLEIYLKEPESNTELEELKNMRDA